MSLIGLIQSRTWLAGFGVLFLGTSLVAGVYARRARLVVSSAAVSIEGHSIDSLNIANLRRRVNKSLVIQEANHVATIRGQDLQVSWNYAGYCRAETEASMEFSIDADNNVPFDALECFAYDLECDPYKQHKIKPLLVGTDGISKKIAVPFLRPLGSEQRFRILLQCELRGCIKPGFGYFTSTLSFQQDQIRRYSVRLVFLGDGPDWLRVYECGVSGAAKLLKEMRPTLPVPGRVEYIDTAADINGQSARIYVFRRPPPR